VHVELQPSPTGGDLERLVMKAGSYAAEVTFSADAGTTNFVLTGDGPAHRPRWPARRGSAGAGRCPIAQLLINPAWSIEG
jgi:hypothetical protein